LRRIALAVVLVCLASCHEDPQAPAEQNTPDGIGAPSFSASDQTIIDLGAILPNGGSRAWGLNNRGQVVGESGSKAFIWEAGVMRDIGALIPFATTVAWEINDLGQVVGQSDYTAFLWQDGTMTSLGKLAYGQSVAFGINESGTVVGASHAPDQSMHGFVWTASQGMRDMGPAYPGAQEFTVASDINEQGEAILYAYNQGTYSTRSFLWTEAGGLEDLGLPPGATDIWLLSINDRSEAVGWALMISRATVAIKWSRQGGWSDPNAGLNPVPSTSQALAINNNGDVVGWMNMSGTSSPCYPAPNCAVAWLSTGQVVNLGPPGFNQNTGPGGPEDVNDVGQAAGLLTYGTLNGGTLWQGINASPGPAPSTDGPYSTVEGGTISVDASSTPPFGQPLTFNWSFGDNTPGENTVQATHRYEDGRTTPYVVTLTATAGNLSRFVTSTATVTNLPPTVEISPNPVVYQDKATTLNGSFTDLGLKDQPWAWSVSWGDGFSNSGNLFAISPLAVSHSYTSQGTYTQIFKITDKDGGVGADTVVVNVIQNPQAPLARTNGPYTANEGGLITFDASTSSDPQGDAMTFSWNFGDGTPAATGAVVTHAYRDNSGVSPYLVKLSVTDAGGELGTMTTPATVANMAPTVGVSAMNGWVVGTDVPVTIDFSDPGTVDGPWIVTWNWGDGTLPVTRALTAQGQALYSHNYTSIGPFTITATVRDKNGATGSATTQLLLTRANQAPVATAGGPYTTVEGNSITLDASASYDPDGDPLSFTWSNGQTGAVISLNWPTAASFPMNVRVTDSAGAYAYGYTTVTFSNLAPTLQPEPDRTVTLNVPLTLDPVFDDAGNDPPYTMVKTWGDGTSSTTTYPFRGSRIAESHTYTSPGVYTVNISLTDRDGAQVTDQFVATVIGNLPPVPNINGPYSGNEGVAVAFSNTGSVDPNGDPMTYRWDFGDGSAQNWGSNPSHVFTDNGVYTVQLKVVDSKGLSATVTTTATIANVPPTGTFNRPASTNEGTGFTLSITSPNDVARDKTAGFQYAFDCGTGLGAFSNASSKQCPQQPDNLNLTVGGQIRDKDGGVRSFTGTVQVKNVAPKATVTATSPTTIARGATFSLNGSFTDPGATDAPWTWSISWGDGKPPSTGTGTPGAAFPASHVYSSAGTRTVKMTVTDKNGGKGTSNSITVRIQ
jgi:probable HAF family extracellular repeat protein